MANIGLRYPIAAPLQESPDGKPSYSGGFVLGRAISTSMSIDFSEATLYADNVVAERVKEFKSGKITLNIDDLEHEVQAKLFGRSISSEGDGTDNVLSAKTDDTPPYVGFGSYGTVMRRNVRYARAIWLYKCQFSPPNVDYSTRGDNIEFKTPTTEGIVMALADGKYMDDAIFEEEDDAIDWLNNKAGITPEE